MRWLPVAVALLCLSTLVACQAYRDLRDHSIPRMMNELSLVD